MGYTFCMSKQKSPLRQWIDDNRWTLKAIGEATGFHPQTVYKQVNGDSYLGDRAVKAYKKFGVPPEVLQAHFHWLMNRA